MKKLRLLSVCLTIFAVIGLTGCSEEDPSMMEGGPGPDTNTGSFRVHYNEGAQFVADEASANAMSGMITITGSIEETGEVITMSLRGNTKGLYRNVNFTYVGGAGDYTNVDPDNGVKSGIIEIKDVNTANKTISGQFSFLGYSDADETMPFYNGTFTNITYTGELPDPAPEQPTPAPAEQVMKAKVNGTLVDFPSIQYLITGGGTTISGTSAEPISYIQISLGQDIVVGTYDLADVTDNVTVIYVKYVEGMPVTYTPFEGTLNISSVNDSWVTGTFSFKRENSPEDRIDITEGSFNVDLNP